MTTRTNTTKYAVGFHTVNPADLTPSAYNPAARVEKGYIADLVKSLADHGQYMPILVDTELTIIDGHRRHAALLEIGESACIVRVIDSDASTAYAEVNVCSKKLSGNDHLSVYLKSDRAISTHVKWRIAAMEKVIGIDGIEVLTSHGGSTATFNQAVNISRRCGMAGDKEFIMMTIKWLLTNKQTYLTRRALDQGISPATLKKCIIENKSLKMQWGVK